MASIAVELAMIAGMSILCLVVTIRQNGRLRSMVFEQDREIEATRGALYDCRALLRGDLSGPDQLAGVLSWVDHLLGDAGDRTESTG